MHGLHRAACVAAVLVGVSLIGGACQGDSGNPVASGSEPKSGEKGDPKPTPTTPQAKITVTPKDKAEQIKLDTPVSVKVADGKLTKVSVTDGKGKPLAGEMDPGKTTWTASTGLGENASYKIDAEAVDDYGKSSTAKQTFSTADVSQVLGTDIMPENGSTVGVGQPIAVKFSNPVENKAEVEKKLVVQTSPMVEGSWHWFGDSQVHWRPENYWPAQTKVTLKSNLQGVNAGNEVWGVKNKTRSFQIGRSVVSKIDLKTHKQQVYVDGKLAKTLPITGGTTGWETRSGVKVVLERRRDVNLRSETIGVADKNSPDYYDMFAPYALRVTWSGEFLHSAPWSTYAHGNANVSHGCVGMTTERSKWLYDVSQVGDIVEVTGSKKSMPVEGNGYGDWNMSWSEWQQGSALS